MQFVSIDCGGMFKGDPCGKTYDWIYNPADLLVKDNINPAVLEEMEKTLKAASPEEIEANYMSSMLMTNRILLRRLHHQVIYRVVLVQRWISSHASSLPDICL